MLYVLPFKLFEFLLTGSKFIIKNLIIAKEDKVIHHLLKVRREKNEFSLVGNKHESRHILLISDIPLVSSYVFHAQTQIFLTLHYSHPFSLCNRNVTIFVTNEFI